MTPFTTLAARACPLPLQGVDTDQLIPARFMKRSRAEGYGKQLLHDMRFGADGAPVAGFPLNQPRFTGAQILVARRNFGTGSSREAAVYALADYGFRCVVAASFGDIFAANAVNNGVLPARVGEADAESLLDLLERGTVRDLRIDLDACTISAGNRQFGFEIAAVWRAKLLNGWDDLDLTLSHRVAIDRFQAQDRQVRPWAGIVRVHG